MDWLRSIIDIRGENFSTYLKKIAPLSPLTNLKFRWKPLKVLGITLTLLLMLGCHQLTAIPVPQNPNPSQSSISVNLESQFSLQENQVGVIESENLKIKFLKVEEDSRCPSEVQCVWSGQVTIVVNVVKDDRNLGDFRLTERMGDENQPVKNFDSYFIKLLEVAPYPQTTQKLETSDYKVTLLVSPV